MSTSPPAPDILEALHRARELVDVVCDARQARGLIGRLTGFGTSLDRVNQLPVLLETTKASVRPLLPELWSRTREYNPFLGAVRFGDVRAKTYFELALELANNAIELLKPTAKLLHPQAQGTKPSSAPPGWEFAFTHDKADQDGVKELMDKVKFPPTEEWNELKTNLELEAISLRNWRAAQHGASQTHPTTFRAATEATQEAPQATTSTEHHEQPCHATEKKTLAPSRVRAVRAYQFAKGHYDGKPTYRNLHDWLVNCPLPDSELPDDIRNYDPPQFTTWKAYVEEAKRVAPDSLETTPLLSVGRSVVPADAVAPEEQDEWARPRSVDADARLDELCKIASDLFAASPGHARERAWAAAGEILRQLGESQERINRFSEDQDVSGLLRWVDGKRKSLDRLRKR